MRTRLILILALICFGGCQNASQLLAPGGFDANKTASGGGKSAEDPGDRSAIDKIVSTDAPPPPGSLTPVVAPPQGTGVNPVPTGDGSAQGGGTSPQYMMAAAGSSSGPGPMDPKIAGEGVATGHREYQMRYGAGLANIVPADASVPGSGDSYPLEKGNVLNIKLLLQKAVVNGKDQYGNNTYGWTTEPNGPQVRLWFRPAGQEVCQGWFVDTKVSLSSDGENVEFSNLPVGPGTISFWIFEHVETSPLPEWMSGMMPDVYQTTPSFHEGSLAPLSETSVGESWYTSERFGIIGSLLVRKYVDPASVTRIAPQSAP